MRLGPRSARSVAIAATCLLMLAGCGDGGGKRSTELKHVAITIKGGTVTPNAESINVSVDQPIELDVTADKAGELHAHTGGSGQSFDYHVGTTKLTFAIATPGVVPVESHELNKTIVLLYAR